MFDKTSTSLKLCDFSLRRTLHSHLVVPEGPLLTVAGCVDSQLGCNLPPGALRLSCNSKEDESNQSSAGLEEARLQQQMREKMAGSTQQSCKL